MRSDDVQRVELPFLCRCEDNTVDSQQRLRALAADRNWIFPPDKFLSCVTSMAAWYDADLSYGLDQWWRAVATIYHYDAEAKETVTDLIVTVQCDLLEDGFAELVLWLIENRPGTR